MPVHTANVATARALVELVATVEELGEEIVAVLPAGQGWAAVTKIKPKPGRPKAPKAGA